MSGWEAGEAVGLLGVHRVEEIPYRSLVAASACVGVPGVSAPVCFSWHSAAARWQREELGIRRSGVVLRPGGSQR